MPDKYSTRYTLLRRATLQNDQKAWNEIIRFYQNFIYFILQSLNLNEDECEELLQIISVQIWQSLHRYDIENSTIKFRYWVRQVTKNQAYAFMKKKNSHKSKLEKLQNHSKAADYELPLSSKLEEEEEMQWKIVISNTAVQNIKNDFSPKALEAFTMHRDGKSTDEISTALDVSADCVYKYISRLRERLTKEIKFLSEELDF